MTGDMWPASGFIALFIWSLRLIMLGILIAAIWIPKSWKYKALSAAVVLAINGALYVTAKKSSEEKREKAAVIQQESKEKEDHARAIYEERCKSAGVFIHRTAENVDGVFLMKVRKEYALRRKDMEDPYGQDETKDDYIQTFLAGRDEKEKLQIMYGYVEEKPVEVTPGYRIVDAIDPKDGQRYRYKRTFVLVPWDELLWKQNIREMIRKNPNFEIPTRKKLVLVKEPATAPFPRYGVIYEDISTPEDREYWVAGSSLKVIDLETNEVMAERIGYMFDPAQGEKGWGDPWHRGLYNACPAFPGKVHYKTGIYQTRNFVEQVLKPKQEQE